MDAGRYRKKVEDQEKEISQLEAAIEGYRQMLKADDAIVAAVVKTCGEVCLSQEDINSALSNELGIMTKYDAETRTYTLRPEVKTNGKGTG